MLPPRRSTFPLIALMVLGGLFAVPAAGARGQQEPAADPPAEDAGLEADGRRLLVGEESPETLFELAARLLREGHMETLRMALRQSNASAALATLRVLQQEGAGVLIDEILWLAARQEADEVSRTADAVLLEMVRSSDPVVGYLAGWLRDAPRDPALRRLAIRVLGMSRNLAAFDPLVAELDGPFPSQAHEALVRLTGHRTTQLPESKAWRAFRAGHADWSRELLLEEALRTERTSFTGQLESMREQVVRARTELMGQEIPLLAVALQDEYPEVRRAAAAGLAGHSNPEAAAEAVPELMGVLGLGGETPGAGEVDPGVRAAIVTCVGKLGWKQPEVQAALIGELGHDDAEVREAAVVALAHVRDVPAIVEPLLEVLFRADGREDMLVTALETVADNRPAGVLPRLVPWMAQGRPARVRAAAARAVLACDDLDAALEEVEDLRLEEAESNMRYAVAQALGHRLRSTSIKGTPLRRITSLLQDLASDPDPSVRAQAASSLGRTGERVALAILEQRAGVEVDENVLERIVDALGELRLPVGVAAVGRICTSGGPKGGSSRFEAAAQRALASIGEERNADLWVRMGDTLAEVTAWNLATWCYTQVEQRFGDQREVGDAVDRARGRRAEVLVHAKQFAAARTLLLELHQADAPLPALPDRLELLAEANEELGDHDAAAGFYLQRLALISEGASSRTSMQLRAADALVQAGRPAEALPLLDELHAANPSHNEIMYRLAEVQETLGRWEDALATAERLLERMPSEGGADRVRVQAIVDRLRAVTPSATEGTDERPPGASL